MSELPEAAPVDGHARERQAGDGATGLSAMSSHASEAGDVGASKLAMRPGHFDGRVSHEWDKNGKRDTLEEGAVFFIPSNRCSSILLPWAPFHPKDGHLNRGPWPHDGWSPAPRARGLVFGEDGVCKPFWHF